MLCLILLLLLFSGLCLEKLPISSSASNLHVDREQEIVTCYEKAGDIALLYLQEIERVSQDDLLNWRIAWLIFHRCITNILVTQLKGI